MRYADGTTIRPGDIVRIDGQHQGRVIASMDTGEYLLGQEVWAGLSIGIMVDTDFGGLVHYTDAATDFLELLARSDS